MINLRHSIIVPLCLLGALPAPLLAQQADQQASQDAATPTCGGQPAQWLGGSRDGSDISTAATPLATDLQAGATNQPYLAFRVTRDMQTVRVEAKEIGTGDPSIVLTTMDGDRLAENDDANGTLSSQLTQNLGPGDYCVQLVPVQGTDLRATVQVSLPEMPPLVPDLADLQIQSCTPDDQMSALFEGDAKDALPAKVQTQGGVEYLRLSLSAATPLTLRADSISLDPTMVLYDANGQELGANDDTNGLNAQLDFASGLPAGEYCLGVAPVSQGEGTIDVSAAVLDVETMLRNGYRSGDLPPAPGSDVPMRQLDLKTEPNLVALSDGTAQWFTFDLAKESVLIISAYGAILGVDTRLTLFDSNGASMGMNDDSDSGTDAQLGPLVLPAGTYRMALTDVNTRTGSGGAMRPVSLVFETYEKVE
ncbi:MAG: hypothetical protein L0G27_11205 [Paracoccus sp. (in: a-proteobacteria)]|nr:hypothetical protein [Paracoccus sp. (in: a-proteobacteria)]